MDDYGSLAATAPDHAGFDLVEAMSSAVRAKFIAMGVTPHKETSGLGLSPSLGVEVTPDLNLQVVSNRLKLLEHGTRHASRLPRLPCGNSPRCSDPGSGVSASSKRCCRS